MPPPAQRASTATMTIPHSPRRLLVPLSPSKRNAPFQPLDTITNRIHLETRRMNSNHNTNNYTGNSTGSKLTRPRIPLAARRADDGNINASSSLSTYPIATQHNEKKHSRDSSVVVQPDQKNHVFSFSHPPPMTPRGVGAYAVSGEDKENYTATGSGIVKFGGTGQSRAVDAKRVKRKDPPPAQQTLRRSRFVIHRDAEDEEEGRGKRRKAVKFQAPQEERRNEWHPRGTPEKLEVKSPVVPEVEVGHPPGIEDIVIDDITDPMEVDDEAEQEAMRRAEEERRREREREREEQRKRRAATQVKKAVPPSVLTALLLSHTNPGPTLPDLPSPPLSRLGSSPAGSRVVTPLPPRKSSLKPAPRSQPSASLPPSSPVRRPSVASAPPQYPSTTAAAPLPDPASPNTPRTFALDHLPQISHHTASLVLTLYPPTHVTLTIRHSDPPTIYTIYASDGGVSVHGQHYTLPELPWKHLSAFRYARRFVEFVASRTLVATTRLVGDVVGKLWADNHGEVDFPGGVMVRVSSAGVATVGRGDVIADQRHLEKAVEVWRWMRHHPEEAKERQRAVEREREREKEREKKEADAGRETGTDGDGWEIDKNTRFVRDVGWCKAEEKKGLWWMRFLDGVRMLLFGDGKCRWWEPEEVVGVGRWKGLKDDEVRKRVAAFVEAGL